MGFPRVQESTAAGKRAALPEKRVIGILRDDPRLPCDDPGTFRKADCIDDPVVVWGGEKR